MTSTRFETEPTGSADRFFEWFKANTRGVSIAGIVVALALVLSWMYSRHQQNAASRAARDLVAAKISLGPNTALAKSDFKRVSERHKGTSAGTEAALILAQLEYQEGQFNAGLAALEGIIDDAPEPMRSSIASLIADGYSELKKPGDAATWYDRAARSSRFQGEQETLRARAARAHTDAGDAEKAKAIWTDLVKSRFDPSIAAEAKVRLAELTAKPAA